MSDESAELPEDVKAALGKLIHGEPISADEEALLEAHKDNLGIEATDH
jgi:hypothetical protein